MPRSSREFYNRVTVSFRLKKRCPSLSILHFPSMRLSCPSFHVLQFKSTPQRDIPPWKCKSGKYVMLYPNKLASRRVKTIHRTTVKALLRIYGFRGHFPVPSSEIHIKRKRHRRSKNCLSLWTVFSPFSQKLRLRRYR